MGEDLFLGDFIGLDWELLGLLYGLTMGCPCGLTVD